MRKHRVKVVSVEDDIITLGVDGVLYSYLIQRPQSLSHVDVALLRNAMDTHFLESLTQASGLVSPQRRLLQRLFGLWRPRGRLPVFSYDIADFIEKVGVEVTIDKKTTGVVILKSDVDRIRKGELE